MGLWGCETPRLEPTERLDGETYSDGLVVDGHEFDGLVIENCRFTRKGLRLQEVDSVVVRNCMFEGIDDVGIRVGFNGGASHVLIENCSFKEIGSNGISSWEDAVSCTIRNCTFEDIALSQVGAAMAQAHHGIYWMGPDVLIEGNTFRNGRQSFGNAVSVRSSGIVRRNYMLNAAKNGIMYYPDHPGGDSLLIENNMLAQNTFSLRISTADIPAYHNKKIIIRFNTIASDQERLYAISDEFEATTEFEIYGNLFFHPEARFGGPNFTVPSGLNFSGNSDPGFVDLEGGDLHLIPGAPAAGYLDGETRFPATDIDGDPRSSTQLDPGADEIL